MNYDQKIIREIEAMTSIPVTTTFTALLEAMKVCGVKKISMVTPYQDWINDKEKIFLEENGIKVLRAYASSRTFAWKRWPLRGNSSIVAANFSLREASVECPCFTQAEACGYKK